MKEVKINSTKINEVNKEVVFEPQLICIDSTDVRFALRGKSGVMYREAKSAGESIPDFMVKFFDELKSRKQVMDSSHYLIHLMVPKTDEFTMEHMGLIHDFFETLGEDKEILWGMSNSKEKNQMTMTVLCTKDDDSKANKQILVCAPSGAGKTTLVKHLLSELGNELGFCVSVTTRKPRTGEANGESYEFVSQEQFEGFIKDNALLEYEQVYQCSYYGTLAQNVEAIEDQGKMPLFDVDVKGALKLKSIYGRSMKTIFIMPPSVEELRKRLEQRGTDSMEKINERVAKAESEMTHKDEFDCILVNDDLDKAKAEILQIAKDYLSECNN